MHLRLTARWFVRWPRLFTEKFLQDRMHLAQTEPGARRSPVERLSNPGQLRLHPTEPRVDLLAVSD